MAALSSPSSGSMFAATASVETPFNSETQTLRMVSEANVVQKRSEREIPEITTQKKRAIANGRIYATVMAPSEISAMDLKSPPGIEAASSSNIDVPEVNGRGDLLIASAGVEFKNMNLQGLIDATGIVGVRQSTAFLLRLFEKNIGLVVGANNRVDYDAAAMSRNADFTRLDEDFSEITSGYLLPPDQNAFAPTTQTWTLQPRYIGGGDRLQELVSSAPSSAGLSMTAAVATAVDNVSAALFGSSTAATSSRTTTTAAPTVGLSSTTSGIPRPRPRPNLPKPTLSSSTTSMAAPGGGAGGGGAFSEEDKMAFSPVSPIIDWIDRVVVTRELVTTTVETEAVPYIGEYLSGTYFGPQGIQLSLVTFTIHGTRKTNGHERQTVEYTHHFLHVDIRCWADNTVPSILGKHYKRLAGKDLTMLNGYNEMSALIMFINALVYMYGNGRIPVATSPIRIRVNGEPLEERLARIQQGSNSSMSTSISTAVVASPRSPNAVGGGSRRGSPSATAPILVKQRELLSDKQVTTAGPTNRVLVHCAAGIGRTGVILTLLQYFSPFNPAPHSWLNIIRGMRGARKDMVMVNVQWKFLQYYTDMFAFDSKWVMASDPNITVDEGTQGSNILPEMYLAYMLLGQPASVALFRERNEIFSILLRMYYATLSAGTYVPYITRQEEDSTVRRVMREIAAMQSMSNDGGERMMQFQAAIERATSAPQSRRSSTTSQRTRALSPPEDVSVIATQVSSGGGRRHIEALDRLNQVIAMYAPLVAEEEEISAGMPAMQELIHSRTPIESRIGPVKRIAFAADEFSDMDYEGGGGSSVFGGGSFDSPPTISPRRLGGGTPYESITGLSSMQSFTPTTTTPTTTPPRSRSGKRTSPSSTVSSSSPSKRRKSSPRSSGRSRSRTPSPSSRRR